MKTKTADPFGFKFWLMWILTFAGSLVLSAIVWTAALVLLFKEIQEPEIVLTWCFAVFGTWFVCLTPFMRKKEQIWKRLNQDQEKAVDAFLRGISLFIGSFVLCCTLWAWFLKKDVLTVSAGSFDGGWIKAVLVSSLILMLPLLVYLYKTADVIFKSAVSRQTGGTQFQKTFIEKSKRSLSNEMIKKIEAIPPTLDRGHILTLILEDGRSVPDVFIWDQREILGIYNQKELSFDASQVVDVKSVTTLPAYEEEKWLRLDGRG